MTGATFLSNIDSNFELITNWYMTVAKRVLWIWICLSFCLSCTFLPFCNVLENSTPQVIGEFYSAILLRKLYLSSNQFVRFYDPQFFGKNQYMLEFLHRQSSRKGSIWDYHLFDLGRRTKPCSNLSNLQVLPSVGLG